MFWKTITEIKTKVFSKSSSQIFVFSFQFLSLPVLIALSSLPVLIATADKVLFYTRTLNSIVSSYYGSEQYPPNIMRIWNFFVVRTEAAKIENVRILFKETFIKFCKNIIKAIGEKK